ncbi:Uncharacterized protein ehr_00524 [Ehrlichia minasensis]|nr:Uncharacterized protein ehr_00524 [Ehrlichia minasensis]
MKIQNTIFILLALQVACSPIYDNKVAYKDPESESGKACVVKCAYIRNDCYRQCQINATNCRLTEKIINVQERSSPFISIVNNNAGKDEEYNPAENPCESKNLACKKSCANNAACKTQCDMSMDMCNTQRNLDRPESFDEFFSNRRKNSATVKEPQPISLCKVDECERLCRSDYNLCFSSCGGQVITYKQCVAFCNKK